MKTSAKFALVGLVVLIGACAPPPPANEMERKARMAASAEIVARQCAGFAGGYSDAVQLRGDANRYIVDARALGATDQDIQRQRDVVQTTFQNAVAWVSRQDACNQLVSELAWQSGQ